MSIICETPEDTEQLGAKIGRVVAPGAVLAFRGGLGAGKTCLIRGLAAGLEIKEIITSPTYTIANEYEGRMVFYHIDAYRLDGPADFEMLDSHYYLYSNAVCAIEWSETIEAVLPPDRIQITLEVMDNGSRKISIEDPYLERALS
ncbi:MAG: tRNA (adenosine(37)-N6)-threonylcarbamoyltransferase complex ATPase subunit type 1 TsaE [Spirochaetes bacterium]|nr:tRNA (adenosine(37)-N6)-threonylcarbamoyltransferase complex ATPase subunit type 1 TsaE [Spirochaetota bacterium]MBU0955609.1 tRNA (adenosine(37)-N6)-threonylcarbamoyltransferase complex ATPase subunit type 1 TsaE [Spirochaetota bacterium]